MSNFCSYLCGGVVIKGSSVKQMVCYPFLEIFPNDDILDADELRMLEYIALRENQIDDEELDVLCNIFAHAARHELASEAQQEIDVFRTKYQIWDNV